MSESEESKLVVDGTLIKQEPLDGDSTETCHNVYDSLIDVFKQENCSNSLEKEHLNDCHIDPPKSTITKFSFHDVSPADMKIHIKAEPSQAEVSLSTDCALTLAALLAKDPKPMNYSKVEEASSVKQICFTPRTQQILNKVTVTDNRDMNRGDSAQGGSVARRGDTLFSCDQCSYKTDNKCDLLEHMKTHTRVKPYFCKDCDYKCSTACDLARHTRTHTGDKPFSCTWCDYKYSRASSLKRHMRTHTGEKPYSCKHCDYKCSTASYLKSHMRTHTGEKPFSCDHCDYKCSQRNHLKTHLRTHTGIKPYACTICDHKFSTAGHLKSHMNTHTGYKPYSCKQCDFKCARAYTLKVHNMRTHTGKKPF
ncbi:zinc finger protein OZF-like [Maniola hyperantus]|uniref:zinc finger protein OZF-like n=1 Tax=Aphantopus hyperantus TaxID=2795564 RepID=UPI0037490CD3